MHNRKLLITFLSTEMKYLSEVNIEWSHMELKSNLNRIFNKS